MSKEVSGTLGFIIPPNNSTQKLLTSLVHKHSQKKDRIPTPFHLSLYHGQLKNLPVEVAKKLLADVSYLINKNYSLNSVEPYGDKFLFWNVEKPHKYLQKAHETIVDTLSRYVDKEKVGLALKEGLKLSSKELSNMEKYSHPLVKDLFLPHFTILFRESGVTKTGNEKHEARVEEIQFAEIGSHSKIRRVILTSP